MRRKVIMLAGAAALTIGALMSGADARIERGTAALSPSLRPLALLVRALLNMKTRRPPRSIERRAAA